MHKNLRLLSVVVTVVEKSKKYLKRCLSSLEESASWARIEIEIIIICNGILIDSPTYLKSSYKILKNKKNTGFGKAINRGMKIVQTEWCIILNPDTVTNKNTIKVLIDYIDSIKSAETAIVSPKILNFDNSLQYNQQAFPSFWTMFLEQSYLYKSGLSFFSLPNSNSYLYSFTHEANMIAATFWLIRTDLFLRIGGFDSSFRLYFEDVDLCKRIRDKGYKIIFIHNAIIYHYNHGSSGGYQIPKIYVDSFVKYLSKYHRKPYILIAVLLYLFGTIQRLIYLNIFKIISNKYNKKRNYAKKIYYYNNLFSNSLKYLTEIISSIYLLCF